MFGSFHDFKPTSEQIQEASDALALAILQHLKKRHQMGLATVTSNVRHDVFRYLFKGKGQPSQKRGCILLNKDDFKCCFLYKDCEDWDKYVDALGDGKK